MSPARLPSGSRAPLITFLAMQWTKNVVRRVLPNGLTVLVQRDTSAPVVAVVTHVKAGYFDEPDEWVGIAHVLEHMYFKGTHRRGPGEIARETQLAGGYINAATIYDKTVYYTVLPSADDGLVKALEVQSDALTNAALDPEELARELIVIVEEAKRKLDTPSAVASETLFQVLFTRHRMRRWRIGTEDQLKRLTVADLRAYYQSRYTPDRVVVGITGDIDPNRALDLAAQAYGGWHRTAELIEPSPSEPPGATARAKVLRGDLERPLAVFGWKTVAALHEDAPALDVAAGVLSAGRASRLFRELRAPGLASGAGAYHYTPTEVGVFAVSIEGEDDRLDTAVQRATDLVAGLGDDGPGEAELDRVRTLLGTQWCRRFETADGRAAVLCEAEALGDYRLADELYRRTLAVSVDDVARVARKYLDPSNAGAVLYLPTGVPTIWENGGWPPKETDAGSHASAPRERRGDPTAVPRRAGSLTDTDEPYPSGIFHRRCDGADMVVRSRPGSGLVSIGLHVGGLRATETEASAGLSWLLARAALRGAGEMSAEDLAWAAERLGGGIAPVVSADVIGWWLTVEPPAARAAAALLRLVALEPRLASAEVAVERDLQASDARSVRDDMFRYPVQRVRGEAFPADAYGLPALGDPDTVQALTDVNVREWANALADRRASIVAVGDLEPNELLDVLEPLSDWPGRTVMSDPSAASPVWNGGRGEEERQKAQTAVAMAFPAPPYRSHDRYVISVMTALLSGLAGRLFDELRERRSLAYTVAAMPWLAARAGAIATYIATSPEREDEARNAMLAELRRLVDEPVTAEELERARRYAAGSVEVRRQAGRVVAEELLAGWIHGTLHDFADVPAHLRAVTVEDIQRVATKVFVADQRAEYVVRGGRSEGR